MWEGMLTSAGVVRMPAVLVTREDVAIPFTLTPCEQCGARITAPLPDCKPSHQMARSRHAFGVYLCVSCYQDALRARLKRVAEGRATATAR